ncbi:MAG: spore coat protein U domain-containing protein [Spirochaetota bacterium]
MSASGLNNLKYQIFDNAIQKNILKDLSGSPSPGEVLAGTFPASSGWQTVDLTYLLYIPAGQFLAPGKYEDTVTVTLYAGTIGSATEYDSQTVTYQASISQVVDISIVRPAFPFDPLQKDLAIDFGILKEGATNSGDIIVRSNAAFSLSLQSDNKGVMANLDRSDKSTVPYVFIFNGSPVNLTGTRPVDVLVNQSPTDLAGFRYNFTVIIQPYGMATEGSYQDIITVTIATK